MEEDIQRQYKDMLKDIQFEYYKKEKIYYISCCENPSIRYDYTYAHRVCVNCGIVKGSFDTEEQLDTIQINPLYELSTIIAQPGKYKNLRRLHNWKNKNEIKEMNANDRYQEIKDICFNYFKEHNKILYQRAKFLYMNIYINQNICSRGKIRFSNYIYCIYKTALDLNIDIDIYNFLKHNKLTITNYNNSLKNIKKGLDKLNDKDKNKYIYEETQNLYLHKDLEYYRKLLNDNYNLNYSQYDIIKAYNIILNNYKKNGKKLIYQYLIAGTLLLLVDNIDIIKFCQVFNIKDTDYYKGEELIKI